MTNNESVVHGSTSAPLWTITLGALIDVQAHAYGDRTALVVPWQKVRRSYKDLAARSKIIAKALLDSGLQYGDCVGIMAGNCSEYVEVFLGAARIGCPTVVLNSNYTPTELHSAIVFSNCKLLCMARFPGPNRELTSHIDTLLELVQGLQLILFDDAEYAQSKNRMSHFDTFCQRGVYSKLSEVELAKLQSLVRPVDTLNLQFTSGTTGAPKAAMLSHVNLINNGNLLGDRLGITSTEVICCPPPLFHCFGLVIGFMGAFTHGSNIVYPSQQFDAARVLDAIETERCTILYGVPTMYAAELDVNTKSPRNLSSLKMALAAGSPVSQKVVTRLKQEMGIQSVLIAYGMTETSPVTFATTASDTLEQRLGTVGAVLPHTGGKIIDAKGRVVPRGVAGEICTSGFALQSGYLKNPEKTQEAMKADADGVIWMHTGDEGIMDAAGYLRVTGRIKDLIIRGGENIVPTEVEERLLAHKSILEAAVVGVPHAKYGEAVACFLRQAEQVPRPTDADLVAWVREVLGRHKAPEHVWWLGDSGVGVDFPKTASGKHQKHILRSIGTELLKAAPRPRL